MLRLKRIHHIAIIASDYIRSKAFYCDLLGFMLLDEVYRVERHSWKGRLALNGVYRLELFSFPHVPARFSYPEACGLRHLAFEVEDFDQALSHLTRQQITYEQVRVDTDTQRRFTFIADPDKLPLELYQQ